MRDQALVGRKREGETLVCADCGTPIYVRAYRLKDKQVFRCQTCARQHLSEYARRPRPNAKGKGDKKMTELSELKETMNQIKETLDYILKAENIYIERELRLNYIRDEIRHLKENVECTDDAYEKGLRTGLSISESILSITIPVSMAFARTVAVDIGEWEKKNQEASSQAPEEEPK